MGDYVGCVLAAVVVFVLFLPWFDRWTGPPYVFRRNREDR